MKRLPFTAKDFADYLVKYDNSCEWDAFDFPDISESRREKLLDLAEQLMKDMELAIDAACAQHCSSLDEVLIQLDLHTSQYRTSKKFWMMVFKETAKRDLTHWLVGGAMVASANIVVDYLRAGLLDRYVEEDNLYDWLTELNMSSDSIGDGASILEISKAWCKRKSKLEKKKKTRKV